jgi:predicted Zn-dependent peptidase
MYGQERPAPKVTRPIPAPTTPIAPLKPVPQVKWDSVSGDPLHVRITRLSNGLTIMLSENHEVPRIQTFVAVRAGSRNDPAESTGLAHYLEHMLFKGTDRLGALNPAAEKPLLDSISVCYERYRTLSDSARRAALYRRIDSLSGAAARYAVANEYDRLVGAMGARGTNAHTSFEETVYHDDIPSNQLINWLTLQAERFRKPVMRLFHTELEAVYEEKNRHLDDDGSNVWESLLKASFPNHPYGTQSTIGTIAHLKNPSLVNIERFLSRYYVPGNMALIMSGDFRINEVYPLILETLGKLPEAAVPSLPPSVFPTSVDTTLIGIFGPDAETTTLAWRFNGNDVMQDDCLSLFAHMLSNGKAGLFDLSLKQTQQVLDIGAEWIPLREAGLLVVQATAKEGQSLESLRRLIELELMKAVRGGFNQDLMDACVNDLELKEILANEQNWGRANGMMAQFISGKPWSEKANRIKRLRLLRKDKLQAWLGQYWPKGEMVVLKHLGDRTATDKIIKPVITPVATNADLSSAFANDLMKNKPKPIEPVFADYAHDVNLIKANGVPVYYTANVLNDRFTLDWVWSLRKKENPLLSMAFDYLALLGTDSLQPQSLQKALFGLGCTVEMQVGDEVTRITLSGLSKQFNRSLALFEHWMKRVKSDKSVLAELIDRTLKTRADAKLDKQIMLGQAMKGYLQYDVESPFAQVLSNEALGQVKQEELIAAVQNLWGMQHEGWYYGPMSTEELLPILQRQHQVPKTLKPISIDKSVERDWSSSSVFLVDRDMKQAEVLLVSQAGPFDPTLYPAQTLYQEYFSGGMQSLLFQTLRESKALAYGVSAQTLLPVQPGKQCWNLAYIGTQADKLPEALAGMRSLLDTLIELPALFDNAKAALDLKLRTERVKPSNLNQQWYTLRRLGLNSDPKRMIFDALPKLTFSDLVAFQKRRISGKPLRIGVLGPIKNIDASKAFSSSGTPQNLDLKKLYGY